VRSNDYAPEKMSEELRRNPKNRLYDSTMSEQRGWLIWVTT